MRHLVPLVAAGAVVLSSGAAFADLGDQLAKLLADDGMANDNFGHSVAISGITVIVGAWFTDDNGAESGSAYLFDTTTGQQISKLLPNDGASNELFGNAVAINDATAIVGAWWDDDDGDRSGSAYLFDTTACPWDLNGDGAVGPFDLALLLGNWGLCADPDNCPEDLDGNGEVGPFDLALLLGNWGPCK